jgi:hypothetical protein
VMSKDVFFSCEAIDGIQHTSMHDFDDIGVVYLM